jgi:iron complex transport system ATP-binding protein
MFSQMISKPHNLILFTGRKHSGKTTAADRLAMQVRSMGFRVAGLLAPAVYEDSRLVGFGAVDLGRDRQIDLLNRKITEGKRVRWAFTEAGLKLGRTALNPSSAGSADLIIVDEFGPLEMDGGGWRKEVDLLLASTDVPVVLVVREELEERVQKLYENYPSMKLAAAKEDSINKIIGILKERKIRNGLND